MLVDTTAICPAQLGDCLALSLLQLTNSQALTDGERCMRDMHALKSLHAYAQDCKHTHKIETLVAAMIRARHLTRAMIRARHNRRAMIRARHLTRAMIRARHLTRAMIRARHNRRQNDTRRF